MIVEQDLDKRIRVANPDQHRQVNPKSQGRPTGGNGAGIADAIGINS
jgi:hypothetical protein